MTPQKSVTKITGDTLELLQKRGNTTQSFTIYNEKDLDRTIKNQISKTPRVNRTEHTIFM